MDAPLMGLRSALGIRTYWKFGDQLTHYTYQLSRFGYGETILMTCNLRGG